MNSWKARQSSPPCRSSSSYACTGNTPLARKLLSAPIDNESQTEEECAGVEEAHQDLAAGRLVSREEIRREFGRLHSGLFVPWSAWQRQGTVM
jgi:hypothetical protein